MTDRKLGSGTSGRVFMVIDRVWRRQMACKIVQLKKCQGHKVYDYHNCYKAPDLPGQQYQQAKFWREVDILKDLSHVSPEKLLLSTQLIHQQPNIVMIDRVFYTEFNMYGQITVSGKSHCLSACRYIVEELITGGDLMSYIERHGWRLSPDEACLIIYQIVKAVCYLHHKGVTHRDLKPENILLSTTAAGGRVILTDFGGATQISPGGQTSSKRMQTMTGTANYLAPWVSTARMMIEG